MTFSHYCDIIIIENERKVFQMNIEVIKAMNKKETVFERFVKRYRANNRVARLYRRIYNNIVWSEERANKILSYYVPRKAQWNAKSKHFYFFDNGMGWSHLEKIKLKDRLFWKKFNGSFGGEIRTYLIEKFELDGFEKTVVQAYDRQTEVIFTLKEEN